VEIEREISQYYKTLLLDPQLDKKITIQKLTRHIPIFFSQEHKNTLLKGISLEEVE
jgi:hypothetical protein